MRDVKMEYLDIYDDEGNFLGKEERGIVHEKVYGIRQFIVGFILKMVMSFFKDVPIVILCIRQPQDI